MKKWIKIILVLVALGAVSALLVYKYYINKPHPDFENLPSDYQVKAEVLYKEYVSDKTSADLKYNGKIVEISGKLSTVESADTLVIATFVFKQGDFGDEGIRCTMLSKYKDDVKKTPLGSEVTIKGFCSGYNNVDVIMDKCSLNKK